MADNSVVLISSEKLWKVRPPISEDPTARPGPTEATGRAWWSHLNRCKIHVLAALSNLFQARGQLLATPCRRGWYG